MNYSLKEMELFNERWHEPLILNGNDEVYTIYYGFRYVPDHSSTKDATLAPRWYWVGGWGAREIPDNLPVIESADIHDIINIQGFAIYVGLALDAPDCAVIDYYLEKHNVDIRKWL